MPTASGTPRKTPLSKAPQRPTTDGSERRRWAGPAVLVLAAGLTDCSREDPGAPLPVPALELAAAGGDDPVILIGAGDIHASCNQAREGATARLLDSIPGTVFTLGDHAEPDGALVDYQTCYEPSWGRHKGRTRPTLGVHDYDLGNAEGSFAYFGSALTGERGYYSYDLGAWHIVVLNNAGSNYVPYKAGSAQDTWLVADLTANAGKCILAMWHRPLFFSSTTAGWNTATAFKVLWDRLYAAGADVVVNGYQQFYERFAPQSPDGALDPEHGIRQFIVGTGGGKLRTPTAIAPNSEMRSPTFGVLKFTLHAEGYEWEFVPVAGMTFTDSGSGTCHKSGLPPPGPLVDAGPHLRTQPGTPVQLRFRLTDQTGSGPWSYSVAWGDGSTDQGSTPSLSGLFETSHVYDAAGEYPVQVTLTDSSGRSGNDTLRVFVEPPGTPQVFVGAGDIASCDSDKDQATARLLDAIPGTVFTTGDNAYPDGSPVDFSVCFGRTWGRHKKRIRPAIGNHDDRTAGAAGYFGYFGVAAGDPAKGYYSYELGAWHVVVLNSDEDMDPGSPQEQWLRADLAASSKKCTVALWHRPRFSSGGKHGSAIDTEPLWQALYHHGADLVLVGHEHHYERFAPSRPDGTLDPDFGLRQFVVGSGGAGIYSFGTPLPNSEVRGQVHGVLKLTLEDGSYSWEFVPIEGAMFTDSGSQNCHDAPVDEEPQPQEPPEEPPPEEPPAEEPPAEEPLPVVLLAAGNIAKCTNHNDERTARILDSIAGTALTLGDNAFPDGTLADYLTCYEPTWGRHKARTYATLGNHEYDTGVADGAFDYFGDRVGLRGKGYYSFDLGAWHVIVINSNRNFVPYAAGSEQDLWLQADLAANSNTKCTLAVWHHPRFFSSDVSGWTASSPPKILWERLYAAGADLVLNGQMYHYERLAPMRPDGTVDPVAGIRQFNVGTGGASLKTPSVIAPNSEAVAAVFGVLKLTLYPDRYAWEFVPVAGESFTDSGTGSCH